MKIHKQNIILMSLVFGCAMVLGQFSVNILTPLQFDIAHDLNASTLQIQQSVAVFLAFFAFAQFLAGFVVTEKNTLRTIYVSISLFILTGFLVATVNDIEHLLWLRALQAITCGFCVIAARTALAVIYTGDQLARSLAITNIVFAVGPGLAPLFASFADNVMNWRLILLATPILGMVSFLGLISLSAKAEFSPVPREKLMFFTERQFIKVAFKYAISSALVYGAFYAFISEGPRLFIEHYKVTNDFFGIASVFLISSTIGGSIFTAKYSSEKREDWFFAICLLVCALVSLLIYAAFSAGLNIYVLIILIMFYFFSMGILMPISVSQFTKRLSSNIPMSMSIIGTCHLLGGAWAVWFTNKLNSLVNFPLGYTITSSCLLAVLIYFLSTRGKISL